MGAALRAPHKFAATAGGRRMPHAAPHRARRRSPDATRRAEVASLRSPHKFAMPATGHQTPRAAPRAMIDPERPWLPNSKH